MARKIIGKAPVLGIKAEVQQLLAERRAKTGAPNNSNEAATSLSRDLQKRILTTLTPEQRRFISSNADHKVACCSRRAGKTQAIIRYLLLRALAQPNSECLYLSGTKDSARKIVWSSPRGLPVLIRTLGLDKFCELNEGDMRITFWNGSVIYVGGAETRADALRWKGHGFDLVVIDEAQDFDQELLDYLYGVCISPSLMDRKGTVCLTGTPGPVLDGIWFETSTAFRKGWSAFHWTWRENRFLKGGETWFRKELVQRGLSEKDPIVQREYFGRWVRDDNNLLFPGYYAMRNQFKPLEAVQLFVDKTMEWAYVLGVDIGVRDHSAFVVMSYSLKHGCVYVHECSEEQGTDVTRIAEIIRSYQAKYGHGLRIIMDCGALGLMAAEEMRNRHGLPIEAAEKREKATIIRFMNDALRRSAIRVDIATCGPLVHQWERIQVDAKTQIEKASAKCDLADAALYAWRHCYSYLFAIEPPAKKRKSLLEATVGWLAAKEKRDEQDMDRQANLSELDKLEDESDRFFEGPEGF